MGKKLEVGASEMMALRNEGYSNRDIANILEINPLTVRRYIGCQPQRNMENMAAFKDKPKKKPEPLEVETPEIKRAVDEIVVQTETVGSMNGKAIAEVNYINRTVTLVSDPLCFEDLAEFATFVVGMVEHVRARG